MPRPRQCSISSSCFSQAETGPHESLATRPRRLSTRVRSLLEDVSALKIPFLSKNRWVPPSYKPNGGDGLDPPTKRALELSELDSLPPISPQGYCFAIDAWQGGNTHAGAAGEGLSRFLRDGLPGYEIISEYKAENLRENIGVLSSGDKKAIKKLVFAGADFQPADTWDATEKFNPSRYPTVISMTGVPLDSPNKQRNIARRWSDCLPSKDIKIAECSPDSAWTKEGMSFYTPVVTESSDIAFSRSVYENWTNSYYEGENLVIDITPLVYQLETKHWPRSPSESARASSRSSYYESDEEDSVREEKSFDELFPHQRFREFW